MVKIAIAGGSGKIARGVIDALVATKKHEILIISRKDESAAEKIPGVSWIKTDYASLGNLTDVLGGVHTVLSFMLALDVEAKTQKLMIDASIAAGVKRFAPSEWATSKTDELPWYAEKATVRTYLEEINKEKKVIEYCLFQPGLLVDMFGPPGENTIQELYIDYPKRRAIVLDGKDGLLSFTTANDMANIVARAIEYEGEWPVVGGMKGGNVSEFKLIEIGTKVRGGKSFEITSLKEEDVRAGDLKASWIPKFEDPNMPKEQAEYFAKVILQGCLLSGLVGSWVVSDEWNRLLPDYEFTDIEEKLSELWAGQP